MDEESFKRQFLPLHPRLYRIAYAMTGNSQDAEDILQDAYCKLWDKRKELTMIANPEAFCITLLKNLCLDFLRSARYNREEQMPENAGRVEELSPERQLIDSDHIRQVKAIIERLPENQRQVVKLRGISDCSMEEIEEITGLSAVNVRVLLSRARKMIRQQFDKVVNYEQQGY